MVYGERELSKRKVVGIAFLLWLFLFAPFACMQRTAAAPSPDSTFLISPSFELLSVNDNFTITVNLTNAQNLFGWQIALKYNGTGLRLNDLWVPDENVFAGHEWFPFGPNTDLDPDVLDGLSVAAIAAALLGEFDVNVDSGVLCRANFTVVSTGQSLIEVADKSNPAHFDHGEDVWYSFWQNPTDVEAWPGGEEDALGSNFTVFTVSPLVGDVNGDFKVDIRDMNEAGRAFGSTSINPRWNSIIDINGDGNISIKDVALIAKNFGQHFP